MITLRITRNIFLFSIVVWGGVFLGLSTSGYNAFELLNILGFLFLILVPGVLTLRAFRVLVPQAWGYIAACVGVSLLELMLWGLLANELFPLFGVAHPFWGNTLLWSTVLLVLFGACVEWFRATTVVVRFKLFGFFDTARDSLFAFVPFAFVLLSVAGAMRLNNGTDGTLTLLMLVGVGVYLGILSYYADTVDEAVVPTALFFIGLSLLLMTSLRGWFITGHDVQVEYKVFELTKNAGVWNIHFLQDAYNACMSITILPTIFAKFLSLPDQAVYKVLFQVLFAVVPPVLFVTIRRYTTATLALLSVVYFIAFPTFFTDMPMLNRQEIAFIFLALMVYFIFADELPIALRRTLFVFFGVGLMLSHYTTTYTVLGSLLLILVARPLLGWLAPHIARGLRVRTSAFALFGAGGRGQKRITVLMVAVLCALVFVWTDVVTNTASGSIGRVAQETINLMLQNTKQDSRSSDVAYSLFSTKKYDPVEILNSYQTNVVDTKRINDSGKLLYPPDSYSPYLIAPAPAEALPPTVLGQALSRMGLDVSAFNYFVRQTSAKLLQLFILLGLCAALYSRRHVGKPIETEYLLFGVAGLLLMASQVLLPALSAEYGLLRAFQQSLLFLSIFLVLGSTTILAWSTPQNQLRFARVLAIAFLLSSTGVFTQMLGFYDPQLHLNNNGKYYDAYYTHTTEVASIAWLAGHIEGPYQPELQADPFSYAKIRALSNMHAINDIYPGVVQKNAYVYLGYSNVHKQEATVSYNGDGVTYTYPIEFLDTTKNLIYSNGDVEIFR